MSSELFSSSSPTRLARRDPVETAISMQPLLDQSRLANTSFTDRVVKTAHHVYEHLVALWFPGIIEAAYDLGVFNELAKGPQDTATLAETLACDRRGMRVLLDALYAFDFIERVHESEGVYLYRISEELRVCLLPGEMYSLAGKIAYDRRLAWGAWRNFAEAVRTGAVGQDGQYSQNQISDADYEHLVYGINFWALPCIAELCRGLQEMEWETQKTVSVLDVGCGTGLYSQHLLQRFPHWTAVGLDSARISTIAHSQAMRLGVDDRFTCRSCDFWEENWGSGFDLVLFANIFHLQNSQAAQQLLICAARSLAPGGLICVIDHIVDDDRDVSSTQDRFALMFAASMLATGGGDAYTFGDYDQWLTRANLKRIDVLDAPMHRILLATHAAPR